MKWRYYFGDTKWVFLLILLSAAVLLSWVFTVPFDKAPDERAHFGLMYFIVQNHDLPVAGEQRLTELIKEYSVYYGALPSLPYIFGAIGVAIGTILVDDSSLYLFARFMSVLLGIGTIYLAFRIARLLFPKEYVMQVVVPLVVLLIPQSSFIFAYANNDSFATFAITLAYYFIVKCTVDKWSNENSIFLGVSLGLCLLSKQNTYIIILIYVIFLFLSFGKEFGKTIKYLVLSGLTAGLVSGWWFIRNLVIYNGDLLAIKTSNLTTGTSYYDKGMSLIEFLYNTPWITWSFTSSWAVFDYMAVRLPRWYYWIILGIITVSLVGMVIHLYQSKVSDRGRNLDTFKTIEIIFSLSIVFAILLSLWNSYTNPFQPQGKYFFTALIPFVIILVFGLRNLLDTFLPGKKNLLFGVFIGFFLIMNIFSVVFLYRFYNNPLIYITKEKNLLDVGFENGNNINIKKNNNLIYFYSIGPDPQALIRNLEISTTPRQLMILNFETETVGQIYWETNSSPGYSEEKSLKMKFEKGKDYIINIGNHSQWKNIVTSIRVDPSENKSERAVVLKRMEIY